ncbi:unnamed protein product [Adineta steineri]|uniref:Uncharacterized protein n=1 Tax=Adineta steineri TaxID=433720 RepID=A0A815WCF1_9BILA|nr:unnamed protein product [Adineta steineri]CAF1252779.1 unnamed protein product [Adineta steineri]CAF1539693.1 unnamed protein product [Adineta steineri]CAF1540215.1 unnamed protein product [Adineta steineri]
MMNNDLHDKLQELTENPINEPTDTDLVRQIQIIHNQIGLIETSTLVDNLLESKSELSPQLKIAKVGNASDDRRRSETIHPCLTLDD